MDTLNEDLWGTILVRLPLKTIATSKLVCKQWRSRLESPLLRNLFLSHHQDSHSLWSLMLKHNQLEAVSHYGCEIWGHPTPQQLGSYISTFITEAFKEQYREARVVAYTDVGLILIRVVSFLGNVSLYVANPVSRECVETDPPWFEAEEDYRHLRLATRTDKNGVVLGYKVVLLYDANPWTKSFHLLIYSSETGLWRQETIQFPYSFRRHRHYHEFGYSISLNGHLHWIARNNENDEVVVSINFFDMDSDHPVCRVTHFPDLEMFPQFQRCCSVSQGSLMYMNVVSEGDEYHKLSVWRLKSSWEWQLVSEISYINDGYHNNIPLAINPFDAETVYFWNNEERCLVSMNLRVGEFVLHGKVERSSSDGCTLKSITGKTFTQLAQEFSSFVLPKWLYRIPTTVANNSRPSKPSSKPTFIWWPPKTPQPNQDKLNNTWQTIKRKQSVKGNSSSSAAHRIATANSFSMLEDN